MIEETIFHILMCSVICVIIHFFFHKKVDDKNHKHNHNLELSEEQKQKLYDEFIIRFWATLSPPTKDGKSWNIKTQDFEKDNNSTEKKILDCAINKAQEVKNKVDGFQVAYKKVDNFLNKGKE